MSLWRMIWQEIAHRKSNFVLGLLSVVVAIGTLAGVLTLLKMDKLRADESGAVLEDNSQTLADTSESLDQASRDLSRTQIQLEQTRQELEKTALELETEMREITKGLGFNILVLSKDEDLHAMNLSGIPQKTIPEANVDKLANSDIFLINHLLPIVTKRIKWEEKDGYELLLTGTRGEVPQVHQALKKPLQEQVPAGTMIVGNTIAKQLNLSEGQTVKLKGREFKITKVQDSQGDVPDSTVWVNLKEAQEMLGMQNQLSAILALECNCASADRVGEIRDDVAAVLPGTQIVERGTKALARAKAREEAKSAAARNKVVAELNRQAAEKNELVAQQSKQAAIDNQRTAELNHVAAVTKLEQHEALATVLTPMIFVACGVWIGFLSLTNVRQRAAEIGILRAIGWRASQIMSLFLVKALILGVVGAVLGYAVGFAVAVALSGGVFEQSQLFNPLWLVLALVLAPLLSALATWIPALTAARNDPAVILQGN